MMFCLRNIQARFGPCKQSCHVIVVAEDQIQAMQTAIEIDKLFRADSETIADRSH
jgi:hypothetical protein